MYLTNGHHCGIDQIRLQYGILDFAKLNTETI